MNSKEVVIVSFSGGKTSAYMSYFLKKDYGHLYDFVFIFANTGQEREETLVFVDQVDRSLGLGLVWVEAVVNPEHGKGIRHKIVDFNTASRNGEPFEAHIKKSGIPNPSFPQCSDRLKLAPIEDYKKKNGLRGLKHSIGIRADEAHRKSKNPETYNLVYPLCDWFETDKQDVNTFWESQSFTLDLEEHQGNCKTCWKKSNLKLYLLAKEDLGNFDFMLEMERKYKWGNPTSDGLPRVFFRGRRSTEDILNEADQFDGPYLRRLIGLESDQLDMFSGCSESCEAYF